jgi:SAM-dependent methyltransferase
MSETEKHRDQTVQYCTGNGVDIGSQNDPVVPWAISLDLPHDEYAHYTSGKAPENSIQWRGDGRDLPFKDGRLDFVYSSHMLEDFLDWGPILTEWTRVLKQGGRLIIMVPDKLLWNAAIRNGQPPNCAHQHEAYVGELTWSVQDLKLPLKVLRDELTAKDPADYNILFVAEKL